MPSTISLYCPHCADRIQRPARSLDFEETVTCPSCKTGTRAAALLTGEGQTLVDYFAAQSVQVAKRLNT